MGPRVAARLKLLRDQPDPGPIGDNEREERRFVPEAGWTHGPDLDDVDFGGFFRLVCRD